MLVSWRFDLNVIKLFTYSLENETCTEFAVNKQTMAVHLSVSLDDECALFGAKTTSIHSNWGKGD